MRAYVTVERWHVNFLTRPAERAAYDPRMAKFNVLASVVPTRLGGYLVMVATAPRSAWPLAGELDEVTAAKRDEADTVCRTMIDTAIAKIEGRGDEVSGIIGPYWPVHD